MKGFNLKSIRLVESAQVQIKDPSGEPTGVVFMLAGPEHPDRKRIQYAQVRVFNKNIKKTGRVEMPEPEDADAQKKENLAAYTLGWEGFVDEKGDVIPFSKQYALELYSDPEMAWLVDQLDAALGDKELFIKRSASA